MGIIPRCDECKQNSAGYIQENLYIIKKFESEGKIEFSHQINKLILSLKLILNMQESMKNVSNM